MPPAEDLVAFRYSSYDVPFWVRPNTRPGRWHVVGDPPTQYWSLTPEAAWAEHIRFEELRSEAELDEVRMPIWVCRLSSMNLLDLFDPAVRDHYGLTVADLTSDDWSACQQAGAVMRSEGARGVLGPCAALGNGMNVTLFGPRRAIDFDRRPALASVSPAALVAIGRPPRDLLHRVIPRGNTPTLF